MEQLMDVHSGRLLALSANIRLGWKGLPGTSALAYDEKAEHTAVKSFITLATDRGFKNKQKLQNIFQGPQSLCRDQN